MLVRDAANYNDAIGIFPKFVIFYVLTCTYFGVETATLTTLVDIITPVVMPRSAVAITRNHRAKP